LSEPTNISNKNSRQNLNEQFLPDAVVYTSVKIFEVKGEDIPVLNYSCTTHEDVWGNGGKFPPFLVSAIDGGE
jgi:hypothetical protein